MITSIPEFEIFKSAKERIAENKAGRERGEHALSLDLRSCGMKELPKEIEELTWLEDLDINRNDDLVEWTSVSQLVNLRYLKCYFTKIKDLTPIANLEKLVHLDCSGTNISDLSPLSGLLNLKQLSCSSKEISDLSPIAGLVNLEKISFFGTRVIDLSPLSKLINLKDIYCASTKISDLSPLADLINLERLDCYETLIRDLSPIAGLTNLNRFDCHSTQVSDLMPVLPLIKRGMKVKWDSYSIDICVKDCPLVIPPIEIVKKGTLAVQNYLEEIEKGIFKTTEIKLILVGNSTAGKTSLSRYLRDRKYEPGQPTTHGIQSYRWQPDGLDIQVNLWDFGGQEYYHATHRLFLSRNAVYTLVWDAETDKGGFCETPVHFDNDSEPTMLQLEHFPQQWWLQNIRHLTRESNPPVPVLMVQNKCARDGLKRVSGIFEKPPFNLLPEWLDNHIDLEAAGDPEKENHKKWLRQFETFEERLLEKLQTQLTHYEFAVYHRGIRDKVRQLAAEGVNDMSYPDFEQLCRDIDTDAKMDLVQIYLRDITGDILYYPDNQRLRERVFLRPSWVCDNIYKILSREVQANNGLFGLNWVREALGHSEGVTPSHPLTTPEDFVELMREFELVFDETDETGQPTGQLVAPQYLPETCTRPGELDGARKFANLGHAFTLWFPDFLPKSHIARFVAHWGRQAKQRLFWKNGLLFQTEGCTALVERIEDDKIRVDIQSGHHKRPDAMQRIFQSFMHLEDGQAGFAVSLDAGAGFSVGVTDSHPDTKSDFVWWRDVQEAVQTQARHVKTFPPETAKYIDLQPFTIFQQPVMPQPKKVFISYSHKDEDAMKELDKFLGPLERKGDISIWTDRKILPGQNWKNEILRELESADLTLLLVSASFLDSDFIHEEEIPRAFQRMNDHGKQVIPIILNYCLWDITSLSALQATPKDGRPIADFPNPAQAWSEVARGILTLLNA